jgi:O-antigen biosynthesis protein
MQNVAFQDKDSEYYTREKSWMVPFVETGPNIVLDLGCASGRLGKRLLDAGKAKELIGAEIFPAAAEEAAKLYKKVYVGDVEETEFDYDGYFDYVICGDILEHLKDPYRVVKRIHSWLKPGGSLLVCVPDVRNFRVLRDLVWHGRWEYVSSGILDKTHLRFFTRSTCREMLEEAGFEVYHSQMIIYGPKKNIFNRITAGLFSEFLATQVFCCGRKPR